MKTLLISLLSALITAGATLLFCCATESRDRHPEIPTLQTYSAVPRFEPETEVFGHRIDLSEVSRYERFDRELTSMCYTHSVTLLTIKRANRYFPMIIPILEEEGVPTDFIYLAAIESTFNPRALSPVKAAGIWQFMTETAKRYGLEVNADIDERYNIEKATRAACRYLKEAYEKYGDWMTVAASYNAGQARISRQLETQNVKTALDLLLVEETSRYMFRIMALKEIMSDPYRYGFVIYSDQLYRPIRTKTIEVTSTINDLTAFANKHGLTYAQLKDFNPWMRSNTLPDKSGKLYKILIPVKDDMKYGKKKSFPIYNPRWVVDGR